MSAGCHALSCLLASDTRTWLSETGLEYGALLASLHADHPLALPLVAALIGAILASLSGVVADRLPGMMGWNGAERHDMSLSHPPSHCTSCDRRLGFVDLVPVLGYAVTRGRCGSCRTRIPVRYPLIETLVAIASFLLVRWNGAAAETLAILAVFWLLVCISWLDWTAHEIPDMLSFPLLFTGLLLSPFDDDPFSRILATGLGAAFILFVFSIVSSMRKVDANSYGDVALVASGCAWAGVGGVLPIVMLTGLAHLAYALPLLLRGREWVPMGPAISVAILVTLATGLRF